MIKLQLHENWQLCNIRQLDWIPAQIPGDIYAALLKNTERYLIMKKRSLKIVRK